MRVVLDTNVLVAAYVARGLCADLLERVLTEHALFASESLLAEFERMMGQKLKFSAPRVNAAAAHLRSTSTFVELQDIDPAVCRDPNDAHVLALARDARADVLVTGDADLLVLEQFAGVPIIRPREFWLRQALTSV